MAIVCFPSHQSRIPPLYSDSLALIVLGTSSQQNCEAFIFILFCLSDWLFFYLSQCPQVVSTLMHITVFSSFLWLQYFTVYIYFSLSVSSLIEIEIVSTSQFEQCSNYFNSFGFISISEIGGLYDKAAVASRASV